MGSPIYAIDPVDRKLKADAVGIRCPECGCRNNGVKDSRAGVFSDNGTVTRTRCCADCDHRWKTYELTEDVFKGERKAAAKRLIKIALGEL